MELTFLWKETNYEQTNELMNGLSGGGKCCAITRQRRGRACQELGITVLESDRGGSSWKVTFRMRHEVKEQATCYWGEECSRQAV